MKLLSLFDYSGRWSDPFFENGWLVDQWDIKIDEFMDINLIEDADVALSLFEDVNGIIAASGAHTWMVKDADGRTYNSLELVRQVLRLVNLFSPTDPEYDEPWFWAIENPVGRMAKLAGIEEPPFFFNPCEFAGWLQPSKAKLEELDRIREKSLREIISKSEADFVMQMEAYTKKTGLWGSFGIPEKKPIAPVYVTSPKNGKRFSPVAWYTGGKSAKTKEARSNTPTGFAQAFFEANKDFKAQFKPGYWERQGWSASEAKEFYPKPTLFSKGGSLNNYAALIRSDKAFEIIDKDPELSGSDWNAGACLPLAIALQRVFGGELKMIVANNTYTAQHILVKKGDLYLDADGPEPAAQKIENFILDAPGSKQVHIADFNIERCSGLGKGSKETIAKIVKLLGGSIKLYHAGNINAIEVVYLQKAEVPFIPSASAMEYYNGKLFIGGDDSPNLLVAATDFSQTKLIKIFSGETLPSGRIEKEKKHDIEASAIVDDDIVFTGSAVKSTSRLEEIIICPTERPENYTKIIATTFYNRVRAAIGAPINIEGMSAVGRGMILGNRANEQYPNNHLIVTTTDFYLRQETAEVRVFLFSLPTNVGLSGLCYVPDKDIMLFTATTEESVDGVADGAIGDSYLGWMANFSTRIKEAAVGDVFAPDKIINLSTVSKDFVKQKIESICVESESLPNGQQIAYMVSDNDNGTSQIFKLQLYL